MLQNISIELVPRNEEQLREELEVVRQNFHQVNTINLPDKVSWAWHSWGASIVVKKYYKNCIPHLRARDFNEQKTYQVLQFLQKHQIQTVLVITGDNYANNLVSQWSCLGMISSIKKSAPHFKVYAGIDPYRQSIREEYNYIQKKIEVGADGFFTQPFFDLNLLEHYYNLLAGIDIFWGVSPVLDDKAKQYWETKNKVVFPKDFTPTLIWNRNFAQEALKLIDSLSGSVYFMPIQVDVVSYLKGILF
jgi:methylenetetrahydrofolate reductase (NADPH)